MDETTKTLWNVWEETTMVNDILYRRTIDKSKLTTSWQMIAPVVLRLKNSRAITQRNDGRSLGDNKDKETGEKTSILAWMVEKWLKDTAKHVNHAPDTVGVSRRSKASFNPWWWVYHEKY